jgi:hypothetical protein
MASNQTAVDLQPTHGDAKFPRGRIFDAFLSPRRLLFSGICLRVVTFLFLSPENVDGHWLVVSFIAQQGRIPHSGELGQAYHPPLYYCLAAPLYRWSGSFKVVQLLSLVLSILSLIALYRLIYYSGLVHSPSWQRYCFLLAGFLPQFVMYTLFVSNDTLAIFLGCCLARCIVQFVRQPDGKSLATLMLVEALGLLTKATFLAYLPVLFLLVFHVLHRTGRSAMRALAVTIAIFVTTAALTSYKEIDNYRQYHCAFVSNIDFQPDWAIRQEQTYQGMSSFVDFNFLHLIFSPTYSAYSESAYPLMLYGTFWYQHVPECNFVGYSHRPFTWIASATYLLAFVPTLVFLAGLFALAEKFALSANSFHDANPTHQQTLSTYALLGLFLGNLGIMVAALAKYHVWSIMQGRLLFPSFFPMLATFAAAEESVERTQRGRRALEIVMLLLTSLFLAYLCGEMALQVVLRFLPAIKPYLRALAA